MFVFKVNTKMTWKVIYYICESNFQQIDNIFELMSYQTN